jgi:hypothetical protein
VNQGFRHWNAKMSDGAIRTILALRWPTSAVAAAYGLNPRYVRKLRAGSARKAVRRPLPEGGLP